MQVVVEGGVSGVLLTSLSLPHIHTKHILTHHQSWQELQRVTVSHKNEFK